MKKTLIIVAYPCCGKTYFYHHQEELSYLLNGNLLYFTCVDSDRSKFSRTTGWEIDYVNNVESNIGKYDFIFVSYHEEIMLEFNKRKIPFVMVAPNNSEVLSSKERQIIKNEWFGRFILRDNSHIKGLNKLVKSFASDPHAGISLASSIYDSQTSTRNLSKFKPTKIFTLKANEYLSDILLDLYVYKQSL